MLRLNADSACPCGPGAGHVDHNRSGGLGLDAVDGEVQARHVARARLVMEDTLRDGLADARLGLAHGLFGGLGVSGRDGQACTLDERADRAAHVTVTRGALDRLPD